MKHTRGPWEIKEGSNFIHIKSICQLFHNQYDHSFSEEERANARLIAAAPELLEALQEFLACGPNAGHNQDLIQQVKSIIARVMGGKS